MYVAIRHMRMNLPDHRPPLLSSLIFHRGMWAGVISPPSVCEGYQGAQARFRATPRVAISPHEAAPFRECTCGYYSLTVREWLRVSPHVWRNCYPSTLPVIVGVYGHVEVHEKGFRSSHQRIMGFPFGDQQDHYLAKLYADSYGVPTVIYPRIIEFASEFGRIEV